MIEWKDAYSVGVEIIDKDHKVLISLVNRYLEESANKPAILVHNLFRDLENYTHFHFKREEDLMAQGGYEHLEEHKRQHEIIRQKLKDFSDKSTHRFSQDEEDAFRQFLSTWLLEHVMGEDFQYKDCLAKLNLP